MLTGDVAPKFKTYFERLENEWLTTKTYAASTLKEIKFKLARYREELGDLMMGQLDVLTLAKYLDGFENNVYTKQRGLLVHVFAFAVAKGLCERNSAELTLVKKEADNKRQRHTDTGPYNMHATALNALIEWGRVHEIRCSQPRLSGSLIFEFGVSPVCRWDSRDALHAGSFTRFWRFAIGQPYKVFPVVGRPSGRSARRSPVEAMRSVVFCAGC